MLNSCGCDCVTFTAYFNIRNGVVLTARTGLLLVDSKVKS